MLLTSTCPIIKGQAIHCCLTHADGTDSLYRNVLKNYEYTLCKNPAGRWPNLHCGGSRFKLHCTTEHQYIMESHTEHVKCSTFQPVSRSANKKNTTRQSHAICQTVKQSLVLPSVKSPNQQIGRFAVAGLSAASRGSCNFLVLRCALIFLSPVCMPPFHAEQQRCGRLYGPVAEGCGKGPTVSNNCVTCTSQLRYTKTDKRNGDYAFCCINISLTRLRTNWKDGVIKLQYFAIHALTGKLYYLRRTILPYNSVCSYLIKLPMKELHGYNKTGNVRMT